jgi:hypothetical protein
VVVAALVRRASLDLAGLDTGAVGTLDEVGASVIAATGSTVDSGGAARGARLLGRITGEGITFLTTTLASKRANVLLGVLVLVGLLLLSLSLRGLYK